MKIKPCFFLACAMLVSCAKEIEYSVQPEQPVQKEAKTYNLTVEAGEGWFAPLPADERVEGCRTNYGVWIRACNHPEHTADTCPYHKH